MAKVQIKSENLTPFGGIFQSWSNLTPCFHLLSTRHLVRDAAVSSDSRLTRSFPATGLEHISWVIWLSISRGNTNVRFHQADTHERFFSLLDSKKISVNRFRADCGSCSKEIVSEIEKHCKHLSSVFSLFSELLLKPLQE